MPGPTNRSVNLTVIGLSAPLNCEALTDDTCDSGGGSLSVVIAPAPTSDSKTAGNSLANKLFDAFVDTDGRISTYSAVVDNADGGCTWSDGGSNDTLGPYTPTESDGDSGVLLLHALDIGGNVLATATHVFDRAAPAAGTVVAPADTSESTAVATGLSSVIFGAFTDPHGLIDNYLSETVNAAGNCSWSGSGLGAYTPTDADGNSGVLLLHARDVGNNILATAVHAYSRGVAGAGAVIAPASTDEYATAGNSLSNKTFSAFTDAGSVIDNYLLENVQAAGTPSWAGTHPAAIVPTVANGEIGTLLLHARDSSNNVLATAVHSYGIGLPQSQNLVAGADPTRQLLVAGTTNSSTITFNSPTGGVAPYVYTATLHSDAGSSAVLTGSGLGPYAINTMVDGEVHVVELVGTDAEGNECSSFCSVAVQTVAPSAFVDLLNEDYETVSGTNSINSNGSNTLISGNNVTVSNASVTTWEENTVGLDFNAQPGDGGGPYTALHDDISSSMDYRDIVIYDMHLTVAASGLDTNNDGVGLIVSPTNAQSVNAVRAFVRMDSSGNYQFNVGLRGSSSWSAADEFELVASGSTTSAQNIRIRIVETRGEVSCYADAGSTAEIPTTTLSGGLTYGRSYVLRDSSNAVGVDHVAGRYAGMYGVRGGGGSSMVDATIDQLRIQRLETQVI